MSLYEREKKATSEPAIAKDKNNKTLISNIKKASCCMGLVPTTNKLDK
jgi:hypothetical protein